MKVMVTVEELLKETVLKHDNLVRDFQKALKAQSVINGALSKRIEILEKEIKDLKQQS